MLLNCGVGESWTLESPLDCKEIQPVHPKGDQSWVFIGRTDGEAETPIFWPPEELTHLKRPWCWEGLGAGGEGDDRGWDGWLASLTPWTWVWANSGNWWWTGRPACCGSWGCKESDMTQQLNWTEIYKYTRGYVAKMIGEGNGTPLQYSCLENPMGSGAWWAAVHGVTKSRSQLSNFTFTFNFHALEQEMATHSSVFTWRIPGTGEPGGLPSMGLHRVGHDWSDLAAAAACSHDERAGKAHLLPQENKLYNPI